MNSEKYLKYIPDSIFAFLINLKWKNHQDERVRIFRKNGSWYITCGDMGLFSPTSKMVSFGMNHFKQKFERVFSIQPDDICLDVGACIGDTTVPMCRKGKHVVAVEPCARNFHYLVQNTRQWDVNLLNTAITAASGTHNVYMSDAITGHSVIYNHEREAGVIKVEGISLNDLIVKHCGHFDFAKIDIQGYERTVLSNNSDQFLENTDRLVVECHRIDGGNTVIPVMAAIQPYFSRIIVTEDRMVHARK